MPPLPPAQDPDVGSPTDVALTADGQVVGASPLPPLPLERLADPCPLLPAGSGLSWRHESGPDFDVCYALGKGEDVFGIYLGDHPSFDPPVSLQGSERGSVGGRAVTWYPLEQAEGQSKFARETMLKFGERCAYGTSAHVWVVADSRQLLDARLQIIAGLRFR